MRIWPVIVLVLMVGGFTWSPAGVASPLPALLYPDAAPYDEVQVPWDLSGPDPHAIVHVRQLGIATAALFGLETSDGDLVMYAYATGSGLFATNGTGPHVKIGTLSGTWHRIDVAVQGATYTIALDEIPVTTLATLHSATEGVFADRDALEAGPCGCPNGEAEVRGARLLPTPLYASSFRSPLDEAGWVLHDPSESVDQSPAERGHMGQGRLEVRACCRWHETSLDDPLAYAHAGLVGAGSTYLLEAAFRPLHLSVLVPDAVPDHQAVLAGVSDGASKPAVDWALVMAYAGIAGKDHRTWALYLAGPDGSKTQVSPTRTAWDGYEHGWNALDPLWHTTRVLVDTAAGTLTVQVDDDSTALRFAFDDLPTSDRLAVGDVWQDHPHWTGAGAAYYDDVTVVPWEGDA